MAVTPTQQALIDAEALFASGNFDMGSDAALMALPMNRSRPDLWDDQGNYTGVSYFDTYEGIRDPSIPSIDPPPSWTYLGRGLDRSVMSAEPIESTAILEALAAREFFDSPLGEERGHVRTGPMLGSLVNQGKVDPATAEEFANLYGNLRPSGYNVTYGREGTPSRVDISESAAEVPWLNYPLGRIRGTVQAPTQEEFEGWQPPVYPIGNRGWRPGLRGHTLIPPGTQVPTESAQRGTWRDIIKRVLSPMSTAGASGFTRSHRVPVSTTPAPEEDLAITEALMQLDEPRIPFSLPPEVRGVLPEAEVQAPFILDQQVDPYTSITTLPIGEEGWTPTLLSDTLGGPVTDQPRTNLDGTITYLTNEEEPVTEERVEEIKKKSKETRTSVEEQVIVASEVQNALANADAGKPVQENLQAIVALSKIDPTIAKRYTTPGSQALQDITSQVESFADMPEVPQPKPTKPKGETIEQKKEAAAQKRRDKKAAAKREAADKRAADKAAAKSKAMSQAQKRNIARAAKASRAAEAAREAATKKAAEDQRRKDKEAQKIWDMHKKMQEQNKEQRAREAARRLAFGYGSGAMYT